MAPMLIDPPPAQNIPTKSVAICADASVLPSNHASKRTRELWWLHGHPHSKRYSNPKLISLATLVRHDGHVYKGRKAFLYPASLEAKTPYKSMTWDEFDSVTETIALSYAYLLRRELDDANVTQKQPTIALLGGGKTLEYFCTQLALQKLGVRVLLLAESNALDALHHLLERCHAVAVITDSKNSNTDTMCIKKLDMIERLPQSSDIIYADLDAVKFQDFGDVWERHAFIIHSSGSTGMPKPIIHTNRSMMLIARMYRLFQDFDVENWFLLFPLYHIAGLSVALSNLPNGQILSFPPRSWPPSSSSIFSAWKTLSSMGHPVHCVHCAPTLIENMYEYILEHGSDFTPLISLKILQPGGAALSDSIVQSLVSHGVNVKTTYGSTEIGPPFRSIPHTRENPKCYSFRNLYPDNPFLGMEEVGKGLYECVVYKGFELAANLWENSDEPYRTNDLFIQDPPNSGFFVLQGRKDDILVHSNGENTSAGPLQLDIQTGSKVICRALALGHSQPCVALLVEVHENYDPASPEIQGTVWETVQKVNARYPSHSQIMRSMIYILPHGRTLPITPKGNIKRKAASQLYASEISTLFSPCLTPPSTPSSSSSTPSEPLSEYLRSVFSTLSATPATEIQDWTTLYDLGINSRLALMLRSSLSAHLNQPVSLSTLFENPSISDLVSHFCSPPPSPTNSPRVSDACSSTQTVKRIISNLAAEFNTWAPRKEIEGAAGRKLGGGKETVLLTGASGSLGTALLEMFAADSRVEKIYAMMRGPGHLQRLRDSFISRGMDPSILGEGGKIEVLNFSMRDPLLGVDVLMYAKLAMEVTAVVQNAWKMDFNLGVMGFEDDCLRNTMSLLRLCHAGRPKTLAFTSSIGTCIGPGQMSPTIPEEPIGSDPSVALSTGYAQSKYIVERLTQIATQKLNQQVVLLRVGQLCGSTSTGHWNTSEMWPIMFASSFHPRMSCIPVFPGKVVDWIPVDVAAACIGEVLLSSPRGVEMEGLYSVNNIVNPRSIEWSELVGMLQNIKAREGTARMEEVSMGEWVTRLGKLADEGVSADELPGLKLLQVFENMAEGGEEEGKVFGTGKSREISKALRECRPFCEEWMWKNLKVWKDSGFLR